MKPLHAVLAIAFVVCGGLLVFGDHGSSDPVVEAAPRAGRASANVETDATPAASAEGASMVSIGALRSRNEMFGTPGNGQHTLFGSRSWMPALPSVAPVGAEVPPLPPIPVAPSMPFTYIGKKAADGTWEVYLSRGDETVIVRDQSVIDANYRVEAIKPPTMTLIYVPLKTVQTIDIGGAD
ncbi:hypothetical protein [Paraburkholderia rhizosphaerae]|uniref:Uncharacterized protein n=1 Tax=Paraburkholderia rhizosphaerae TaxID=480658 RepID=A0A4R8KQ25_9BURK|nr:hypothetical protein [Paraburkholderia rhizosphaerae]TDY31270.1 hypothetical protein BX592_1527 [Paraburkholderia rhizosphaerae]